MIIDRKYFNLKGKCVIEKLIIQTPMRFKGIFNNEACFLYFKEGQSNISAPTEKFQALTGESVLLQCGNYFADLIQKAPNGICEVYTVHLYAELLREIFQRELPSFLDRKNDSFAKKIAGQKVLTHFINSLEFYFQNPQFANADLLSLKIKELMLLLLQTSNAGNVLDLINNLFNPAQPRLMAVINTHLYSDLTLKELSVLAGKSLSTFKREFQSVFHETPARYIKNKRLERAAELLKISGLTISEIAYEVGFNDVAHFSRSFQQKYKTSPLAYKKMNSIKG